MRKFVLTPGGLALAATLALIASIVACNWFALPQPVDGWMQLGSGIGYAVAMSFAACRPNRGDHVRKAKTDKAIEREG